MKLKCSLIIKLSCVVSVLTFIFYTILNYKSKSKTELEIWNEKCNIKDSNIKYILQWTPGNNFQFRYLESSQDVFIKNKCLYKNCFISDDRRLLHHLTCYHAVLFSGNDVVYLTPRKLPRHRSSKQKYIFATMESAHNYPACTPYLDGFFNWTWTYRLDSEARWGYVTAYNMEGDIVAPKPSVTWPAKLQSTDGDTLKLLMRKTKAVAWFVSNCSPMSDRKRYARLVSNELMRFGYTVDVFGLCGNYTCVQGSDDCAKLLRDEYFFYFAFENSISEDYVTEKVVTALNNLVVPVVYGGANYSRFLPPGSYINVRDYNPASLAETIVSIMKNRTAYQEYFKWRNHFYYRETTYNRDICSLCALVNNEEKFNKFSVYQNFRQWWYPNFRNICSEIVAARQERRRKLGLRN